MRRMRRLFVLIAVLASFAGFGATSAQASPWVLTNLNLGDGGNDLGSTAKRAAAASGSAPKA